jgi:RND superfamily putative drug exporter
MLSPARIPHLFEYVTAIGSDPAVAVVQSPVSLDPRLTLPQYQLLYGLPGRIPDPFAEMAVNQMVRDGVVLMRIISKGSQTSAESRELVQRLRALAPPPGMQVLVGGGTAASMDYSNSLYEHFPRAVAFIALSTFMLLLILFRSVVLPIKAIVMNVLSITASFGALVIVFQEGWLAGPLGFEPAGFIEASLPILMFCVLFGVSMDYEVFLLSRVMEAYRESGDNEASVAIGLEQSGGMITSAAAIIVVVAGSFVSADIVLIKALGLGTAIAVLLDATLVRALLVPATMRLLGDWNWWAPAPVTHLLSRVWLRI